MKYLQKIWTDEELLKISHLNSPIKIQEFLFEIPYNPVAECRSPRKILQNPKAHCFEGALFAAAMLQNIGFQPLLLDMYAINDDDHVIAVFKQGKYWGAIGKSNFTTLCFREPVYKTLRELVMSYFDFYFNTKNEKTLRSYSKTLNLNRFNKETWQTTEQDLEFIGDFLTQMKHFPLLEEGMEKNLQPVDKYLLQGSLINCVTEGLFKPE